MIWTWVNSVLILQKRQTVWGMHKHKCRLQNTCSNPFPEFKVNKAQVGGSQVLRAALDLWCQTRGKSTRGNGEVSDKVGGLEKEMLFILDRRCVKGCCRKETDAPFFMLMESQNHGLNDRRGSQSGIRIKSFLSRRQWITPVHCLGHCSPGRITGGL